MRLLTLHQHNQLIQNGLPENRGEDHVPVAKLYMPGMMCTWLLTEIDQDYPHIAFGFADLGMGCPEFGSIDLDEILTIKNHAGLGVVREEQFKPKHPISVYARAASYNGFIIDDPEILNRFIVTK